MISPKSANVGSRQEQVFTVIFNSEKGVGEFRSIILASPELSADELEVADDAEEFFKKGSLGIISLNLFAISIKPKLSIDKKFRMDGENHMLFNYWSVPSEPDAPK